MHKRFFPKKNAFTYHVYYLALPLTKFAGLPFAINRFGAISFYDKDHGARDGSSNEAWLRKILETYHLSDIIHTMTLISMPRILGYVFNPVSFWMCVDEHRQLRAVLAEVSNTFGETHSYLCAHPDHRVIEKDDQLRAEKLFHVSPFLAREGSYQFRFAHHDNRLGIWIDYYDQDQNKQLITALTGTLSPLTKNTLRRAFWSHPLVTLKTIMLIHWQAIKMAIKGIDYITKPRQKEARFSTSDKLTK